MPLRQPYYTWHRTHLTLVAACLITGPFACADEPTATAQSERLVDLRG